MRRTLIILGVLAVLLITGCVPALDFSGVVAIRVQNGFGSGVVVAQDAHGYLIATAAHVVAADPFPLVDAAIGEVVAVDPQMDVALVRVVDTGQGYRVRVMTQYVTHGGEVMALGYTSRGMDTYRLCYRGHVTALRWPGNVFVANCGIFPGMSGGPVLDEHGRIIGILRGCQGMSGLPWETATVIAPVWAIKKLMRA